MLQALDAALHVTTQEKATPFGAACERLRATFGDSREVPEPHARLNAVVWALQDAPTVGMAIAAEAAACMGRADPAPRGTSLEDDALRSFLRSRDCFWRTRFALESTVRYLHSSADLLAQFINLVLALEIDEATKGMTAAICRKLAERDDCAAVITAFDRLRRSAEFEYIADLSNRSKHRRVTPGSIKASLNDGGGIDVSQHLGPFEFDMRQHPEIDPDQLAERISVLQDLTAAVLNGVADALTQQRPG